MAVCRPWFLLWTFVRRNPAIAGAVYIPRRLAEAARMGFNRAYLPRRAVPAQTPKGLEVVGLRDVGELMERLFR